MNILLVLEPADACRLATTCINLVLVNDSDYELTFWLAEGVPGDCVRSLTSQGHVGAGEMLDVRQLMPGDIDAALEFELQFMAYKAGDAFEPVAPVRVSRVVRRVDMRRTTNYKPDFYFDTPVLELPLVRGGQIVEELAMDADSIMQSITAASLRAAKSDSEAERRERRRVRRNGVDAYAANPNKVLPTVEVDLHIEELIDSIAGMRPGDMLELQLSEVRTAMRAHRRRIGQRIIFIHGKGDGVLRREVHRLLRREYPTAQIEDADYSLYGGGATLVIIHR